MRLNKREGYLASLVLVALYFSLAESLIPKPFPWMKIGLSNIATLIALEKYDRKMALEVVILRIIIQAIMLGTMFTPGFFVSMVSGSVSTLITILMYRFREKLSLLSIGALSATIHNITQLVVVYFLLFRNIEVYSRSILTFVLIFTITGCMSGILTGYLAEKMNLRRREI